MNLFCGLAGENCSILCYSSDYYIQCLFVPQLHFMFLGPTGTDHIAMSGTGGCCGGGEHEAGCSLNPANDRSTEFSLYTKIKWSEFCTLNEAQKESGKTVFKSWENRLSDEVSNRIPNA